MMFLDLEKGLKSNWSHLLILRFWFFSGTEGRKQILERRNTTLPHFSMKTVMKGIKYFC